MSRHRYSCHGASDPALRSYCALLLSCVMLRQQFHNFVKSVRPSYLEYPWAPIIPVLHAHICSAPNLREHNLEMSTSPSGSRGFHHLENKAQSMPLHGASGRAPSRNSTTFKFPFIDETSVCPRCDTMCSGCAEYASTYRSPIAPVLRSRMKTAHISSRCSFSVPGNGQYVDEQMKRS